jgi:hypothetical protein
LSHVSLKPAIIKQGVISQSVCPSGHWVTQWRHL